MEDFNQSNDFKASIIEQMQKQACGYQGLADQSQGMDKLAKVDDIINRLSQGVFNRVLKEWLLAHEDSELERFSQLADKMASISMVEFCEESKKRGHSNPFQAFGELLSQDHADVEELPEGSVEQISEEPVMGTEKDMSVPSP